MSDNNPTPASLPMDPAKLIAAPAVHPRARTATTQRGRKPVRLRRTKKAPVQERQQNRVIHTGTRTTCGAKTSAISTRSRSSREIFFMNSSKFGQPLQTATTMPWPGSHIGSISRQFQTIGNAASSSSKDHGAKQRKSLLIRSLHILPAKDLMSPASGNELPCQQSAPL